MKPRTRAGAGGPSFAPDLSILIGIGFGQAIGQTHSKLRGRRALPIQGLSCHGEFVFTFKLASFHPKGRSRIQRFFGGRACERVSLGLCRNPFVLGELEFALQASVFGVLCARAPITIFKKIVRGRAVCWRSTRSIVDRTSSLFSFFQQLFPSLGHFAGFARIWMLIDVYENEREQYHRCTCNR